MPQVYVWGEGVVWPSEHMLRAPDPLLLPTRPELIWWAAKTMDVKLVPNTLYPGGMVLGEIAATPGTFAPYDGALIAAGPAPVLSPGATGTLAAGLYTVAYTYLDERGGESLPSAAGEITLDGAHALHIDPVTPLPDGARYVSWYVSDAPDSILLRWYATNDGAALDLDTLPSPTAHLYPVEPTAFVHANGRDVTKGINKYTVYTDETGLIFRGQVIGQTEWGQPVDATQMWWCGVFQTVELTGLDERAVSQLGKMLSGDLQDGRVVLVGG